VLILDPEGNERYRVEGLQPAEDLLAQLRLGLGHSEFTRQHWQAAERYFQNVVDRFPGGDAAAEAL
jgi:TolA-binding protein